MVNEFIKDAIKYIPSMVGPLCFGLVNVFVISRFFAPAEYGDYILVLTTLNVLGVLVYFWIDSSVLRFMPRYDNTPEEMSQFYRTVMVLTLGSASAITVLSFGILFIPNVGISDSLRQLMKIGIGSFFVLSVYDVQLAILKAKREIGSYNCFFLWRHWSPLMVGMALVLAFRPDIGLFFWGSLIGLSFGLPWLLWRSSRNVHLNSDFSMGVAKELLIFGLPLIPAQFFVWVLRLSDRYFLEMYRGSGEVGLYSIGYDISDKTMQLITALFFVASNPLINRAWEHKGREATQVFVQKLTRYYILVSLPIVVIMSVLSREIIAVLTAQSYWAAWRVMPMVLFSTFLVGLQWIAQRGLILAKRTDLIMWLYLACGLLNVTLNLIFVRRYGFVAAGLTTLITYIALLIGVTVVSASYFRWSISSRSVLNIGLASLMSGVVVFSVRVACPSKTYFNIALALVAGTIIYTALLLWFKELTKFELQMGKTVMTRLGFFLRT